MYKQNHTDLLVAIASVLYAIANSDKNLEKVEKEVIRDFVEDFSSSAAIDKADKEKAYTRLRDLIAKEKTALEAYAQFEVYYLENKQLFTEELKLELMQTSEKIATSFSGKNKSELVMLSKLHNLLRD